MSGKRDNSPYETDTKIRCDKEKKCKIHSEKNIYFGKLSNERITISFPSVELSTLNVQGFAYIVACCKTVHDNNRPVQAICLHAAGTLRALKS